MSFPPFWFQFPYLKNGCDSKDVLTVLSRQLHLSLAAVCCFIKGIIPDEILKGHKHPFSHTDELSVGAAPPGWRIRPEIHGYRGYSNKGL